MHQFDEHPAATQRAVGRAFGVDEAYVVPGGATTDPSGGEPNALLAEPGHGGGQIVDPQANVVERGLVHAGARVGVEWLHQIDFDRAAPFAELEDLFVDVLGFAAVGTDAAQPEQVDPELASGGSIEAADGDLLQAEDPKRTRGSLHTASVLHRQPGRVRACGATVESMKAGQQRGWGRVLASRSTWLLAWLSIGAGTASACRVPTTPYTPLRLAETATAEPESTAIALARIADPWPAASCSDDDGCIDVLVVFRHDVAAETLDANDLLLLFGDGTRALPYVVGFAPAAERDENRSVWARFPDAGIPVAVQVVGTVYDEAGVALRGARQPVDLGGTAPPLVEARAVAAGPICGGSGWAVRLFFGDRVVQIGSRDTVDVEVELASGGRSTARVELTEMRDSDNVIDLCANLPAPPRSVRIPSGTFADTRGRIVSASTAEVVRERTP